MNPLRRIMIAGLLAAFGGLSAVALSACSDDDVLGDDGQQVELSISESDLSPGRVEVDAGEIEFVVKNTGERLHSFAVATPGGVERSENIKPGETARITVDLSEGRYRMYDPRGGYRLRGVSGTVVVTSDEPNTVTERTVTERTVVDEEDDVDVPEVEEPEIQEPEVQEPPPAQPAPQPAPPPTVTKTVPAPPPAEEDPATTP